MLDDKTKKDKDDATPTQVLTVAVLTSLLLAAALYKAMAVWDARSFDKFARCMDAPNCASLHRYPCTVVQDTCGQCMPGYVGDADFANVPCSIDCSRAPNCATLHRQGCSNTTAPHTCGQCLPEFHGPKTSNVACTPGAPAVPGGKYSAGLPIPSESALSKLPSGPGSGVLVVLYVSPENMHLLRAHLQTWIPEIVDTGAMVGIYVPPGLKEPFLPSVPPALRASVYLHAALATSSEGEQLASLMEQVTARWERDPGVHTFVLLRDDTFVFSVNLIGQIVSMGLMPSAVSGQWLVKGEAAYPSLAAPLIVGRDAWLKLGTAIGTHKCTINADAEIMLANCLKTTLVTQQQLICQEGEGMPSVKAFADTDTLSKFIAGCKAAAATEHTDQTKLGRVLLSVTPAVGCQSDIAIYEVLQEAIQPHTRRLSELLDQVGGMTQFACTGTKDALIHVLRSLQLARL